MTKILISWYSFNHDFIIEQKGTKIRRLEMVNEDGPTFNIHRYFGEEYDKHILLSNCVVNEEKKFFNLLVSDLSKTFKHKIETRNVLINDPISISEIFKKLTTLLLEFKHFEIEVFVNPGTPQMQIAWYLLKPNFKKKMTLFQLRETRFTKNQDRPERIYSDLDTHFNPMVFSIASEASTKQSITNKILVTESIKPIYDKAKQIAKTNDVGCLILGESGTGKENLAFHLHTNSERHKLTDTKYEKFKAVNCAAYSDDLLRSELFGHEPGSFTGAENRKIGVFEEASGGTIFLDEIGDISQIMQISLLRVLQEKKIQRVGGIVEIPIDVRVIAATNKNLEELCDSGDFRWDLYYRIAITTLTLPPLREWKKNEIKNLIEHFNNTYFHEFPNRKDKLKFSGEVINCLTSYQFKGNVRELQNLIISLYTFCENDVVLSDLPERITKKKLNPISKSENEKEHITKIFVNKNGNILQTANALGIARDTLKKKLDKYGLRSSTTKK